MYARTYNTFNSSYNTFLKLTSTKKFSIFSKKKYFSKIFFEKNTFQKFFKKNC